jgi:hypothetical protein
MDWINLAQDRSIVVGSCECSNELSCSIKGREFLDQLSNYQFLKSDDVSWG